MPRAGPGLAGCFTGQDGREDVRAHARGRGCVTGREGPVRQAEHARVEHLGLQHMICDRVPVPAAAARALAQRRWCRAGGLAEHVPGRLDQRRQPAGVLAGERFALEAGADIQSAEVGGGRAATRSTISKWATADRLSNGIPARAHTTAKRGAAALSADSAASSPRPALAQRGQSLAQAKAFRLPISR